MNLYKKKPIPENMEQDRKRDRRNKTADTAIHEIAILIINVQPGNQYAITAKKVTSRKLTDPNTENNRKLKKLMDPYDTKKCDTDNLVNITIEIKHVTDRKITVPWRWKLTDQKMNLLSIPDQRRKWFHWLKKYYRTTKFHQKQENIRTLKKRSQLPERLRYKPKVKELERIW